MPAYTPFLTLYKPGGGSTGLIVPDEVVDVDRLNANSDVIDAFAAGWGHAAERNHNFYGPAASRASISGMKSGDTYQESDGDRVLWEQTSGGSWRVFNSNKEIDLVLASGWNSGAQSARFEIKSGLLSFNGRISGSSGAGPLVATLPVDYRPLRERTVDFFDVGVLKDLIIGADGTIVQFNKGANSVTDMRLATIAPFPIK